MSDSLKGYNMNKKQPKKHINDAESRASREELTYYIVMFCVMMGILYGFAQLDAYKAKKNQQAQYQKIERITKTR